MITAFDDDFPDKRDCFYVCAVREILAGEIAKYFEGRGGVYCAFG